MSATNRGTERNEADFYPTPSWCVDLLMRDCGDYFRDGLWLEPAAGDGAIIKAVQRSGFGPWAHWLAFELRDERQNLETLGIEAHCGIDFLQQPITSRIDCIITNPPYSLAFEFVEKCLELSDRVAMLLRLNWLGSIERSELHRRYTPDVFVIVPRPYNDSCEYAWFIWSPESSGRWSIMATAGLEPRQSYLWGAPRAEQLSLLKEAR